MTSRRRFLAGLAAASAVPRLSWAEAGSPAYVAAARDPDGQFALYGLGADGSDRFRVALPDRGHAAAIHPDLPLAVAFARRPGRFGVVIDCATGRETARLEAPEGRHFYGHGCFIDEGRLLVTSENAYDTDGAGRLGIWDRRAGWRRVGEVATGGIGPHDVRALPGGGVVVANGGIRTDPDQGRDKLNIPDMRPSLAYVTLGAGGGDVSDDGIDELVELPRDMRLNSIRHLALSPAGDEVAFAMQWQGDVADGMPLLGLHRRGQAPRILSGDLGEQIAMEGYAGSVAWSGRGGLVAITSPRGGRLHVFDAKSGTLAHVWRRADVCGLATAPQGFLVTDGAGAVHLHDGTEAQLMATPARAWDNHALPLTPA
ncbi:DUF1513 domain-containing protein [Mesobaculum littorinae]|uniref:DUF1513 domain-containing protein n=1 Tax=Mesobaculum littorinae TaxID=2486419 RepID=A0A438AFQ7_9RHOB|nr:DUF1513 domain-containing protein [Mesobaculum littorinae]RVV97435.1 DUF1513 domain-containing protein [Mesobaculum littorinae]